MSHRTTNRRSGPSAGGRRPAYTLLEVLLATTIGVLLLGAVYVALEVQLSSSQAGRDVVEQATLARNLLTRIGDDINLSLGTIDPARYRSSRGQSGGQSGGSSAAPSDSSSGGTTPDAGAAASSSPPTTTVTADFNATVVFNLGVIGDATTLTLYVSRVPRELNVLRAAPDNPENQTALSDLRRITYWLAGGTDFPLGLARHEIKVATSSDATGPLLPEVNDESPFVIAEEVKALKFTYFDGADWQESWDGSAPAAGSNVPVGPPRAIAIEMRVAPPNAGRRANDEATWRTYRHVIAVPVANGPQQQQQQTTTTP